MLWNHLTISRTSHVTVNYGFLLVVMEAHRWQQNKTVTLFVNWSADTSWIEDAEDQVSHGPAGKQSRPTQTELLAFRLWQLQVASMTAS